MEKPLTIAAVAVRLDGDSSKKIAREAQVRRALAGRSVCQRCEYSNRDKFDTCPQCESDDVRHGEWRAFPGAEKANPGVTSPWLIPIEEAEAWLEGLGLD